MTTCLDIRNATHWADTRFIERISCLTGRSTDLSEASNQRLCIVNCQIKLVDQFEL